MKINKLIIQLFILFGFLLGSFLNYCVIQIAVPYFFPINILFLAILAILGIYVHPICLIVAGVCDEMMQNSHIGLFSSMYVFTYYLISNFALQIKKINIACFWTAIFFLLVNFIVTIIFFRA